MNSDELMPDSAPDAIPANNGNGNSNAAVTWNTKKFRDDYDMIKIRLTDQRFSSSKYRCPIRSFLRYRFSSQSKRYHNHRFPRHHCFQLHPSTG